MPGLQLLGGRRKNLLMTLMPFSQGRCGSRAGGHCQTLTPSRRARGTPKSLARSWGEHSAGAAHRDRLWVMLCPGEKSLFPPSAPVFPSSAIKSHAQALPECDQHRKDGGQLSTGTANPEMVSIILRDQKVTLKLPSKSPIRAKSPILISNKFSS